VLKKRVKTAERTTKDIPPIILFFMPTIIKKTKTKEGIRCIKSSGTLPKLSKANRLIKITYTVPKTRAAFFTDLF